MSRPRPRLAASALLLAALGLALIGACKSTADSSSSATSGGPVSATASSAPLDPAVQRLVTAGLLGPKDLKGWKVEPGPTGNADFLAGSPNCALVNAALQRTQVARTSDNFTKDATTVGSFVLVFPDVDTATAAAGGMEGDTMKTCLSDVFADLLTPLQAADSKGTVTVDPIDIGTPGDQRVGYRISLSAEGEKVSGSLQAEIVAVRVGRTLVILSSQNQGDAGTSPLGLLAGKVAGRLADAQ